MTSQCSKCVQQDKKKFFDRSSFLSVLIVMIIPKCPLCVMAYTSAISICGGETMYMSENNWVSYIPLGLSLLINGLIAINRRDSRTYYALGLALIGFLMILLVHQLVIDPFYFDLGSILLFFAIWLNSSLMSVVRFAESSIRKASVLWQRLS